MCFPQTTPRYMTQSFTGCSRSKQHIGMADAGTRKASGQVGDENGKRRPTAESVSQVSWNTYQGTQILLSLPYTQSYPKRNSSGTRNKAFDAKITPKQKVLDWVLPGSFAPPSFRRDIVSLFVRPFCGFAPLLRRTTRADRFEPKGSLAKGKHLAGVTSSCQWRASLEQGAISPQPVPLCLWHSYKKNVARSGSLNAGGC